MKVFRGILPVFLVILHYAFCKESSNKWKKVNTTDTTYGTSMPVQGQLSASQCLAKCSATTDCVSANFNRENLQCELSTDHPLNRSLAPTPRIGWSVYFTGNINDCIPEPCENGGNCTDGINDFSCTCPAGFTGSTCQTNIDDCSPNPCENGGTCTDGVNNFTCTCAQGFSGPTCQTNLPISQWVYAVVDCSTQCASAQALIGPPDVYPEYDINNRTWVLSGGDTAVIEVQFAEAVYITGVEVYETHGAGGVTAIYTLDELGFWVTLWLSASPVECINDSRIFAPVLSVTMIKPSKNVMIEVSAMSCDRAIDAVQLLGTK